MGRKRATGTTGMAPAATSGYSKGTKAVSEGSTAPSGPGNKGKGMGVGMKSGGKVSQGGDPSGFSAGRSRTNQGKNSTCAGKQGFRG